MSKRLYKSKNRIIFGVCGGIADYFNIDPTIVRLVVVILALGAKGFGLLLYLLAVVIIPERHVDDGYGDEHLRSANIDDEDERHYRGQEDCEDRNGSDGGMNSKLRSDSDFNSYFKH